MINPKIVYVTIHPLITTVGWDDGTTTVVKVTGNDHFDEEKGILWAIAKKLLPSSDIIEAFKMGRDSLKLYTEETIRLKKGL